VLGNQSLATQGNYQQADQTEEQNGERKIVSVSVVASDCTHAAGWATIILNLGEQRGLEFADQHGVAALFLLQSGKEIIEAASKHWTE
jgi:thiamine biosynthesis lipoprotein ApbE